MYSLAMDFYSLWFSYQDSVCTYNCSMLNAYPHANAENKRKVEDHRRHIQPAQTKLWGPHISP